MPSALLVAALVWVTLLLVAGGAGPAAGRDAVQRLVTMDLLAVLAIALLALLSYLLDQPYYLDAAAALALLSLVSTVAAGISNFAVLAMAFLTLTSPASGHAMARAAHRRSNRRTAVRTVAG